MMIGKSFGRCLIIERQHTWGLHVRLWLNNSYHCGYSQTFGWHIKLGRFVRARKCF